MADGWHVGIRLLHLQAWLLASQEYSFPSQVANGNRKIGDYTCKGKGRYLWVTREKYSSFHCPILYVILYSDYQSQKTERHVFLLDGLAICCKQNVKRGPVEEYRLKEKINMRKVKLIDMEEGDG